MTNEELIISYGNFTIGFRGIITLNLYNFVTRSTQYDFRKLVRTIVRYGDEPKHYLSEIGDYLEHLIARNKETQMNYRLQSKLRILNEMRC